MASSDDDSIRPLRIGLWEPGETSIQQELETDLNGEVVVVGSSSSPIEIHAVDCLVVDCSAANTQPAVVFETIRESYPEKPLVVITTGADEKLTAQLDETDHTAHVARTESGVPVPVVSARCKRLAKRPLSAFDTADQETPNSLTRAVGLWLLWGIAILTYGVGDVVSTVIAVYFVAGLGEANPVVNFILVEYGIRGFLVFKLVILAIAVGINLHTRKYGDPISYYGPPVFVALVGAALTASNLLAIMGA